jgi:hypothetical protein
MDRPYSIFPRRFRPKYTPRPRSFPPSVLGRLHWSIDGTVRLVAARGRCTTRVDGTKEAGFQYTAEWVDRRGKHVRSDFFDDPVFLSQGEVKRRFTDFLRHIERTE